MAELAALGLAGNILQFVDFGIKLFQEARVLYRSSEGVTPAELELETTTRVLRQYAQDLETSQRGINANHASDSITLRNSAIAKECNGLADELLQLLESLRIKDTENRKWSSFKHALSRVAKRSKIENMERRLNRLRDALNSSLISDLKHHQPIILKTLRTLREQNMLLEAKTTGKLEDIEAELLRQADDDQRGAVDFAGLGLSLLALREEAKKAEKQQVFLQSLKFGEIKARHNTVKESYPSTFEWIFQDDSNFNNWLRKGKGIYWIEGKAGSGKSVLMKFLVHHDKTTNGLRTWAGTHKLFIGSHFFWNIGTKVQKSEEGLLRTLLYQVLKECPDLIEEICGPYTDADFEWDPHKLHKAFEKLSKIPPLGYRFCFFIDGLDEYSGDHMDLIHTAERMVSSSFIKVCASSRPWNVFTEAFGRSEQKLKLEELTQTDIRNYVHQRFAKETRGSENLYKSIAEEVTRRAQGVWLWVHLVVTSLVRGLINADNFSELRKTLDSLPDGLENYFRHIIQHIEPKYRQDSVRYFKTAIVAVQPLPVLAFKFLDEESMDSDYALKAQVNTYTEVELVPIRDSMKKRLNARCRDLLEITAGSSDLPLSESRVDFLHRTVKEFFSKTDSTFETFGEWKPADFDVQLSLCRAMLALIKGMPGEQKFGNWRTTLFSFVDELLYHARTIETECIHGPDPLDDKFRHEQEFKLLDDLDQAVTRLTNTAKVHWTNLRDVPDVRGDGFMEYKQMTFLALIVQAGLSLYAARKINSKVVQSKSGRPFLDYALRPNMVTPLDLPDAIARPDVRMVDLLLRIGAGPNWRIYSYENKTPWLLFLRHCHQRGNQRSSSLSKEDSKDMYLVVKMLVDNGADPDVRLDDEGTVEMEEALRGILSHTELISLREFLAERRRNNSGLVNWAKSLFGYA
ncbi:uncharacterized protein PV07_11894 [Cladophialophora immunda]|uniref:Uncharacterized protein n=1 Tax=Cladophialophora immunda TaxID=569365 RepID=A0A0D2BZG1_9EURO|nr:uncharacterized protein PV07_11894 [Cladophialophora immunda]KIW23715.1 hypothetical protein PV07_11894 [Cladophialophora immunda]